MEYKQENPVVVIVLAIIGLTFGVLSMGVIFINDTFYFLLWLVGIIASSTSIIIAHSKRTTKTLSIVALSINLVFPIYNLLYALWKYM